MQLVNRGAKSLLRSQRKGTVLSTVPSLIRPFGRYSFLLLFNDLNNFQIYLAHLNGFEIEGN